MGKGKTIRSYKVKLKHYLAVTYQDPEVVKSYFIEVKSKESIKAAIGEGAGGIGIEQQIHLVVEAVAFGVLGNFIYDVLKALVIKLAKKRPLVRKETKKVMKEVHIQSLPYDLLMYVFIDNKQDAIVKINLNSSEEDLNIAMSKLPKQFKKKRVIGRIIQEGRDWGNY